MYYLDNSFPHRIINGGKDDRIHLVFDVEVTQELLQWFPQEVLEQQSQRAVLRKQCAHWIDRTVGKVQRLQKRLMMKRQRLNSYLEQRRLKLLRNG